MEAGTFTAGDSIRFHENGSYDLLWSHSGGALFTGTWERTTNNPNGNDIIILTMSEKVTTYYYCFLTTIIL